MCDIADTAVFVFYQQPRRRGSNRRGNNNSNQGCVSATRRPEPTQPTIWNNVTGTSNVDTITLLTEGWRKKYLPDGPHNPYTLKEQEFYNSLSSEVCGDLCTEYRVASIDFLPPIALALGPSVHSYPR